MLRESDAPGSADDALAPGFGAAVNRLRQAAGLSLNELARRAGVDPAYIHRIEASRRRPAGPGKRPPLPRRGVVIAIALALGSDNRQTDHLLALGGHAPAALLDLGGWDNTLASVAELLIDPALDGPAKAEFREVVHILSRRWVGSERQR